MLVKKKIPQIIFWLSFMPYLLLLGYSIYHAIFGYDVYTMILSQYVETLYGWDAFLRVLLWTGFAMCIIPVLPVCLLYQILYLFIYIIKRLKSKVH